MAQKSVVKQKSAVKKGRQSKRNDSSTLATILNNCQSDDTKVVKSAIQSLEKTFCGFLTITTGPDSKVYLRPDDAYDEASLTPEEKEAIFLRQQYSLGLDKLQRLMLHANEGVQRAATVALCDIVKAETAARSRPKRRKSQSQQQQQRQYQFAVFTLRRVVLSLLDDTLSTGPQLDSALKFLELDDFRFSLLRTMELVIREKAESKDVTPCFIDNCFAILKAVVMPKMDAQITSFCVDMADFAPEPPRKKSNTGERSEEKQKKEFYGDPAGLAAHRRVFSGAWQAFLHLSLPTSILIRVLNNIHTNVMPHMVNPKLLIDFLTDAYDAGGAISLLALNGLFLLIHKYNLDYPDFYDKLYALLQPGLFYQKYCCRFFRLANLFLSSSHLPSYLVAAFAKRLSRLSLVAPPAGSAIAVAMIVNLLKRHPSCKVVIHRKIESSMLGPNGEFLPAPETSLEADPFIGDESNPAKCRALDSCLWELEYLRSHYEPVVSKSLSLLRDVNTVTEMDLEPYLEHCYESLQADFESEDACLVASIAEGSAETVKSVVTLP